MSSAVAEYLPPSFVPVPRYRHKDKILDFNWGKNSKDQGRMMFDDHQFLWIATGTKAQTLDSPIYTPTGPRRMGDLREGDLVLTADGGPTPIIGVHPQGVTPTFKVTFDDDTVVTTSPDHLWEVHDNHVAEGYRSRIRTTEELSRLKPKRLPRLWVPDIAPVTFERQPVPFDPYVLGLLIGDGCFRASLSFASLDQEIVDAVGRECVIKQSGRPHDHHISTAGGTPLVKALAALGLRGTLSHTKFIPACYRYNVPEVRLAVLQGIMDTDGFVGSRYGEACLEQTSQQLAVDVAEIVQSLGGSVLTRVKLNSGYRGKDGKFIPCKPVYRQVFRVKDPSMFFRLARKRDAAKVKKKAIHRRFASIEPDGQRETACISIRHHRGLYLTNGLIPTHNTGKTTALAKWCGAGLAAGERCAWIGPFHKRTRTGFNHIAAAFAAAEKAGIVRIHSGNDMRIDMPGTGGVLECFSGDNPQGIYGEAFDRVVVDEATRMSQTVYPAVMSTVTATGGKVRFAFNLDQGRRNWAVQGFLKARAGGDPNHGFVFLRTDESPYVLPETIEMMRLALPDRVFRALYMGEIQEDGAGVFRNVESVHAGVLEDDPRPGRQYVIGVDLARKTDYSVATVMDVEFKHVVAFDRRHGEPWIAQCDRIAALAEKWNNATVVPDMTGVGDVVIDALTARKVRLAPVIITAGRSVTETGVPKTTLIQNLIVAIEKKALTFPAELVALTDELSAYEYDTTAIGALVYSAPLGLHDDCVISLALAAWGAQHVFAGGAAEWIGANYVRRGAF